MTAKDAKAMSDRNKWLKISSTIRDTILESCNTGETDVYIERTKLTLTDISYLIDLGYKFIPDDEKNVYCYISWE
jgi:hypothetical protein